MIFLNLAVRVLSEGVWLALLNLAMIRLVFRLGKLGWRMAIRMAMLGVKFSRNENSSITEGLNVEFGTCVFVWCKDSYNNEKSSLPNRH